jgi:histidine triad (HIT) family protein
VTEPCPFCEIAAMRAPARFVYTWPDALAFIPLNPVVDGHLLVIPRRHVTDFAADPEVSAATMRRAAEAASGIRPDGPMNLITSWGAEATQSVFHLHLHLVPRAEGDGLALPWYSGKRRKSGVTVNVTPAPPSPPRVVPVYRPGRPY